MSSTVSLAGNPVTVGGSFLQKGQTAPEFKLVGKDLSDASLSSYGQQRKILNLFPSIDTPTCATSVRKFNKTANDLPFEGPSNCPPARITYIAVIRRRQT